MKLIHCADLHLDSKLNANFDDKEAKQRRLELLQTYLRMVDYAKKNQVQAILIVGDWFDTGFVSATTKNAIYDSIINSPEIEFYYLEGNHDEGSFLKEMGQLPSNLKLFGKEWTSYYPWDSEWIAITGVEEIASSQIYDKLHLNPNDFNIVLIHGQISNVRQEQLGEFIFLPALRNKQIDYLALGHIHSYCMEKLDARGVYCYSGCLEARGFDECGEHGFVLLDLDETNRTCSKQWIPFAKRNLYEVQVDVSACLTSVEMLQQIQMQLKRENYRKESMIKIVLTGEVKLSCEKNIDFLQQQIAQEYYLVKMDDKTRYVLDYQSFLLDPSLKGEFVRCVMNAEEIPEQNKAEVIRCGLLALDGEEIL